MRLKQLILCIFCLLTLIVPNIGAAANTAACDIPACPDYKNDVTWALQTGPSGQTGGRVLRLPDHLPRNLSQKHGRVQRQAPLRRPGAAQGQAGVYSGAANLFAPYYRQASFACLDPKVDMTLNNYLRIGADDVHRAFNYYLTFLNQGRPFILAGHSQGSVILLDLLRSRFHDPHLRKKLVAVYAIGFSVTDKDMKNYPWIKPARRADDTGVVVSWNTQAPGATGSPVLRPGAICINPLNWAIDETPADKSLNLGAVFFEDFTGVIKREVPGYVGARINKKTGALIAEPPEKLEIGHFPKGVLHKFDYAFWYRNLEKNVGDRIKAYLDKTPRQQ